VKWIKKRGMDGNLELNRGRRGSPECPGPVTLVWGLGGPQIALTCLNEKLDNLSSIPKLWSRGEGECAFKVSSWDDRKHDPSRRVRR